MSFGIHVKGHINRRKIMKEKRPGWMCNCPEFRVQYGWREECSDCKAKRPK